VNIYSDVTIPAFECHVTLYITAPQRILQNAFKTIFVLFYYSRYYSGQLGDLGSGAGKGGGGGGPIREAGGAFGKIEAGREEEYFYKQVSTVFTNCLILILIVYEI
jgi:hypothetical protein